MLVVETIAKIRRAYFGQGRPIKAICRDLGVSRKVVRKVIRSGVTEFRYERDVQPLPRIGPWREQLDAMLGENDGKAARERLTLIRIFEALRGLGFEGSYDAVRRYARAWRKERGSATAEAYVPLSFAPGEAYQFDWSHEIVVMNGVTATVKVAHVRLCHSRMLFVRAYPRETQEMVFDAHDRAFAFFRGTCTRGIYDNMKTAVETIFVGKDRKFNRRFTQMCGHYLVDPVACTPASGWEKGQVENQVVESVSADTLMDHIRRRTRKGSVYFTDAFKGYQSLRRCGKHHTVSHRKTLVDRRTKNHINGIEGFWSYAKHILYNYRGVSRYHFPMYLKEIEFRFNHRGDNTFKIFLKAYFGYVSP